MYHKTTIVGNVGTLRPLQTTPQGKDVLNFTVAVNFDDSVVWYRVSAWGALARSLRVLTLRSKVLVEGRLLADDRGNPETYTHKSSGQVRAAFNLRADSVQIVKLNKE